MRIAMIQTSLFWEQAEQNRRMLAEKIVPLAGRADVIILPEMFSTGFSMAPERLAEPFEGPTLTWMQEQAGACGAVLCGSFMCVEGDRFLNRLVWMQPNGQYHTYDKRHLFGLAGEHEHYHAGTQRLLVTWQGWRICPLICYDLRFPVWSRNRLAEPYDLLVYIANWPARRGAHWRSLLPARAIENQAYTLGVNIVGEDGNGHQYEGDSGIWDFAGKAIVQISDAEGVYIAELSLDKLRQYREQLPFLGDADLFNLA